MRYTKISALLLSTTLAVGACTTDQYGQRRPMNDTETGALIGAGIGALLGLGAKDKNRAVLYGIVGGVAGAAVGNYMDKQQKDFELQLKNEIQRGEIHVEKLPQHALMVTMTAQTSFAVDSAHIQPGFYSAMNKIAKIVNKYGKTHLTLVGFTDNTGSRAYNQQLSLQRADSVMAYLRSRGVIRQRLYAEGMGESHPIASNATAEGRAQNRRVEIIIEPVVTPQN